MITIEISQSVWDAIAAEGKFGEVPDDVLRRKYELPVASRPGGQQSLSRPGAGQTTETGRKASAKGASVAAQTADFLGADKVGVGNEYQLDGERVLIKWASYRNGQIGLYDNPMSRADAVIAVLENLDGDRELWKLSASIAAEHCTPSAKRDDLKMIRTSIFRQHGDLISIIEF